MKSKLLGWVFHEGRYHAPGDVLDLTEDQYASVAQHGMCERAEEPAAAPEPVAAVETTAPAETEESEKVTPVVPQANGGNRRR